MATATSRQHGTSPDAAFVSRRTEAANEAQPHPLVRLVERITRDVFETRLFEDESLQYLVRELASEATEASVQPMKATLDDLGVTARDGLAVGRRLEKRQAEIEHQLAASASEAARCATSLAGVESTLAGVCSVVETLTARFEAEQLGRRTEVESLRDWSMTMVLGRCEELIAATHDALKLELTEGLAEATRDREAQSRAIASLEANQTARCDALQASIVQSLSEVVARHESVPDMMRESTLPLQMRIEVLEAELARRDREAEERRWKARIGRVTARLGHRWSRLGHTLSICLERLRCRPSLGTRTREAV